MKNLAKKVAAAWSKLPATARTEATHVVLVFAATFVATAAPAFPDLYKQVEGGHIPAFTTVHALIAAAIAAAVKAAVPVARAAVVVIATSVYGAVKNRKDRKLQKAVQAYLAVKAAADVQIAAEEAVKAEEVAASNAPHIPVNS